jgi:hypothetical protein
MSKELPDYQDADLILRLYDLRRESVMRQSRDKIFREFQPRSWEDVAAVIQKPENPLNVCYRQVSSYWEMAAGFVKHGILNADLFAENCGEALILFAKIQPFLPKLRETSPTAYQNIEWVIKNNAEARKRFELMQARVKAMQK